MSQGTGIEWTDCTWNPVAGCAPVSAGCANCYAVVMTHRLEAMGQEKYRGLTVLQPNGRRHFNGTVRCDEKALTIPLRWRKPRKVFVNSMSDLFHKDVPFEFIDKVFAVMALCPQHIFQILTKRPERMAEYFRQVGVAKHCPADRPRDTEEAPIRDIGHWMTEYHEQPIGKSGPVRRIADPDLWPAKGWEHVSAAHEWPLPNVWLGTSVENQKAADERIPHLLRCPAEVRFLSCEPLLGNVALTQWMPQAVGLREPPSEMYADKGRNDRSSLSRLAPSDDIRVRRDQRQFNPDAGESSRAHVHSKPPTKAEPTAPSLMDGGGEYGPGSPGQRSGIHWVIAGGESGPGSRPCNVAWIRSLIEQCRAAGVACFVKQLGKRPFVDYYTKDEALREWALERERCIWHDNGRGKLVKWDDSDGQPRSLGFIEARLDDSHGGDWDEWPADLRVREFPETRREAANVAGGEL